MMIYLMMAVLLVSCSGIENDKSTKELQRRSGQFAQYKIKTDTSTVMMKNSEILELKRPSRIKKIWVHKHETINGDFFHGGWMTIIVSKEKWQIEGV